MKTTQLSLLDRGWLDRAIPLVIALYSGKEVTSDDLHAVLSPPEQRNWFGVLFAKLKNAGMATKVGYRPSNRPERNGGVVAVWRVK